MQSRLSPIRFFQAGGDIMGSFSHQLFPLSILSLFFSTVGMVFAGLSLTVSPIVWLIPSAIILTFAHHSYIILLGISETYKSPRIYSTIPVACGYIIAFIWSAALVVSVTLTCLLLSGIIKSTDDDKVKLWLPIIAGISLVETIAVLYISSQSHRELKKIRYNNKWKWRIDPRPRGQSPWSISKDSV